MRVTFPFITLLSNGNIQLKFLYLVTGNNTHSDNNFLYKELIVRPHTPIEKRNSNFRCRPYFYYIEIQVRFQFPVTKKGLETTDVIAEITNKIVILVV